VGKKYRYFQPIHTTFIYLFAVFFASCSPATHRGGWDTDAPSGNENPEKISEEKPVNFEPLSRALQNIADKTGKGVAMVLIKDNRIIYENYFGELSADSVIPIASATKWVTTILILDLFEDGLLDMDTPVSDYVPSLHNEARTGKQELDQYKDDILVRHLLSLQTGLSGETGHQEPSLKAQAEALGKADLAYRPGTVVNYSSAGFEMAGYLAELTTGKPWREIFAERLKGPLGLTSMVYCTAPRQRICDHGNPRLSGGIISDLRDYAKITSMLLNKGVYRDVNTGVETRILEASTVDQMFTDQGSGIPKGRLFNLARGDNDSYGFGTWIKSRNGDGVDPVIVSDPGAFGMYPFVDLEKNFAGIYFTFDRLRNQWPNIIKVRDIARSLL